MRGVESDLIAAEGALPPCPVMPNSLILEGMAQTAGILVGSVHDFREKVVLLTAGLNKIPGIKSLDPTATFYVFPNVAAICNELCFRVSQLFPDHFIPAAMLPQSPGVAPETCIPELVKCVEQYGNVAINLNPDPSGGHWRDPPLWDKDWWYPLYEKMVELNVSI